MTETMPPVPVSDSAGPPAPVVEDFVDIWYAPARVFARRARGQFGLALLIVTVLALGAAAASRGPMRPVRDAIVDSTVARMRTARPEMTDAQLQRISSFTGVIDRAWPVVLLVSVPFGAIFLGVFVWIAGKLVGAATTFGGAIMVATYAMIPRVVIDPFLQGIQAAFLVPPSSLKTPTSVSLSLARLLDPLTTSPHLLRFTTQVDVFAIWTMVLVGIGLYVTGRITKGRAVMAATGLWLISAVLVSMSAARQG